MTQAAVGSLAPLVTLAGSELSAAAVDNLVGLRVSRALRLPSRATMDFVDEGFTLSAGGSFTIGARVTIATASKDTLFVGAITGVELDIEHGAPTLTVTADDAAHTMTLGNRVRTFTEMPYDDIVSIIAREHNLKAAVSGTPVTQEYTLQSDTDFGFLNELADRLGYDWWVDPDGTLQFHPMAKDTAESATVEWTGKSGGLQHFSVRATALHPQTVTAHSWDPATQQRIESPNSRPAGTPTAAFARPYLQPPSLAAKSKVMTAQHMFTEGKDGTAIATSAATLAASGAVVATGLCTINPKISVGRRVSVTNVGPASGDYSVTEVEHSYDARGFLTRFTAGDRLPTGLVDTLAAPVVSSFRSDGLVIGIVTNVDGDDGHKGYIKVRFPTLGSAIDSAWARVLSVGAGASRGMTFLPEVNDEVIVGFENGDVSRPVVIGGVYSGKNIPREYGTESGKITKRQIVSRAGHMIEFSDATDESKQHVSIVLSNSEYAFTLGMEGLTAKVPEGKPVTISSGSAKIELDGSGNINLSGKKISLKAEGDIEIVSQTNIKAKSNSSLEASTGQLKLTAVQTAEMSSTGQTMIKGGMVKIN